MSFATILLDYFMYSVCLCLMLKCVYGIQPLYAAM